MVSAFIFIERSRLTEPPTTSIWSTIGLTRRSYEIKARAVFAGATREANFTPLAGQSPVKAQQEPSKVNHFPWGWDAAKSWSRFLCRSGWSLPSGCSYRFHKDGKTLHEERMICCLHEHLLTLGHVALTSSSGFQFKLYSQICITQLLSQPEISGQIHTVYKCANALSVWITYKLLSVTDYKQHEEKLYSVMYFRFLYSDYFWITFRLLMNCYLLIWMGLLFEWDYTVELFKCARTLTEFCHNHKQQSAK